MTDRNAAHRAGCDGFISKPFDLHTLAEYIDRLVGKVGRRAAPHTLAKTGSGQDFR
jgi:CheY-like chemotaxis protein